MTGAGVPSGAAAGRRRAPAKSRWSVSLGHVGGIDVRVHATFAILLVLVVATSGQVDGGAPAAVLWLVLVFACVLVHELGHCAVAGRRGVGVDEILLLPIGGVSRMERLPDSPADEFAIAIVGPLTSLGLAVLAAAVSVARGDSLLPAALVVGPLPTRLFWFNLLLGGFNLLPAFPLDGGRVFRSLLETRLDLEQATHRAARLGRVIAVVLTVVGVLFNLWLVLIAVFIYLGASAEEAVTVLHTRLEGRTVRDLMAPGPVVLRADSTVGDVLPLLRRTTQRIYPVVHDGDYRGMITAVGLQSSPGPARVGDVVGPAAPSLSAGEAVDDEVLDLLQHAPHHTLTVVEDERVVGLLRLDDVRHVLADPLTPEPLPPPPPPPAPHPRRHFHGR